MPDQGPQVLDYSSIYSQMTQQKPQQGSGITGIAGLSGLFGGGKAQSQNSAPDTSGARGSLVTGGKQLWTGARRGDYNSAGSAFGYDIGGYNQDITSIEDIYKGKANSADYGGITGTAIGAYFGGSSGASVGEKIGQSLFPAIRNLF